MYIFQVYLSHFLSASSMTGMPTFSRLLLVSWELQLQCVHFSLTTLTCWGWLLLCPFHLFRGSRDSPVFLLIHFWCLLSLLSTFFLYFCCIVLQKTQYNQTTFCKHMYAASTQKTQNKNLLLSHNQRQLGRHTCNSPIHRTLVVLIPFVLCKPYK